VPDLDIIGAINYALDQEMDRDKTVVVYGEDVGLKGGVFKATIGLQKKYGLERCFDTPLSEAAIVGTAIGMAVNGLKPVVEIMFSGFMFPGYEQIVCHAARMRNRSRGRYNVPIVVRMPYGGGTRALELHSENLETLIAHIPGLKLVIPSNPYDAKGLLISAIRDPDPVIFMEPARIYRASKEQVPEDDYIVPIGKARIVEEGADVTVVAWGVYVKETQKAMEMLRDDEISVELIDLRTISPMDKETIINSVKKTGRFIVIHESAKSFGPGAELIAVVNEEAFLYLEAPPARVTGFDITVPLPKGELHYLVRPKQIVQKIKEVVYFKKH
jgi:pyruvate dehydrogenase E1 component beta subunit